MKTKYKRTIDISTYTLSNEIEAMAWKKTGFENEEAVCNAVRALSVEKRIDMLTEIFIRDLATMHLEEKYRFIEALGGSPAVTEQELLDYVNTHYKDTDEVEWRVDVRGNHYIHPEYFRAEEYRDGQRKAMRKKKWKHNFLTERNR